MVRRHPGPLETRLGVRGVVAALGLWAGGPGSLGSCVPGVKLCLQGMAWSGFLSWRAGLSDRCLDVSFGGVGSGAPTVGAGLPQGALLVSIDASRLLEGKDQGGPGFLPDVAISQAARFCSAAQASGEALVSQPPRSPLGSGGPGPGPLLVHEHRFDAVFLLSETNGQKVGFFLGL